MSYLAEREGPVFVRALARQPLDSIEGIDATLGCRRLVLDVRVALRRLGAERLPRFVQSATAALPVHGIQRLHGQGGALGCGALLAHRHGRGLRCDLRRLSGGVFVETVPGGLRRGRRRPASGRGRLLGLHRHPRRRRSTGSISRTRPSATRSPARSATTVTRSSSGRAGSRGRRSRTASPTAARAILRAASSFSTWEATTRSTGTWGCSSTGASSAGVRRRPAPGSGSSTASRTC